MPYKIDLPNGYRCDFSGLLTNAQIDRLAAHKPLRTLQFRQPVDPRNWSRLEERLFRKRPDVQLRIYDHFGQVPDLAFVQEIPSLQHFYADCLREATGFESIALLPRLKELVIGVDGLVSLDFLAKVNPHLENFSLRRSKSQRLSLESLARFSGLRQLSISGQTKELYRLEPLQRLEVLRFWHQTSPKLDFLGGFSKLRFLQFNLGSSTDLSKIAQAKGLRRLELHWVRQLQDLGFLSRCESLEELFLDKLAQVRVLPNFRPLKKLRWLSLSSRNRIEDLGPIGKAPALKIFSSGGIAGLEPKDYLPVLKGPVLKHAGVYFSAKSKQREFDDMVRSLGISCE